MGKDYVGPIYDDRRGMTGTSSKNVHIPTVSVSHDAYGVINHALNRNKDVRVLWDDEGELIVYG